jgi:hypothetical protein
VVISEKLKLELASEEFSGIAVSRMSMMRNGLFLPGSFLISSSQQWVVDRHAAK